MKKAENLTSKLRGYEKSGTMLFLSIFLISILLQSCSEKAAEQKQIMMDGFPIIQDALLHGYTHNLKVADAAGVNMKTLQIQCISNLKHQDNSNENIGSVWVRDLFWGFQGWVQAVDPSVLDVMKSSIELLIIAKANNQALGKSENWPLNDKRFYIPQAYTNSDGKLNPPMNLYPYCSESQAHFLLLVRNYWQQTGDLAFVDKIWPEIRYVVENLLLLDTNGNALPDQLQGSYDYQWITLDTEESLMCATTSAAYSAIAELAGELGKNEYADSLKILAEKIKTEMNKPVEEGGLWKNTPDGGGYYINFRKIGQEPMLDERFLPYENLGPMYFGMTSSEQDQKIFTELDNNYSKYYDLKYGPLLITDQVGHTELTEVEYTSGPWLGFFDVYLRGEKGHDKNRSRIFKSLLDHAWDIPAGCFTEGLGVYGNLTGGAGRSWDNGNFFHTLIVGILGIEKSKDGIAIKAPRPVDSIPMGSLQNVGWKNAIYHFQWKGKGGNIKEVLLDGRKIQPSDQDGKESYLLTKTKGEHQCLIILTN